MIQTENTEREKGGPPAVSRGLAFLKEGEMDEASFRVIAKSIKNVSPEAIEKLLREAGAEVKQPEVKHFQFVVILADDTNPHDVPAMISKIVGTLVQHRANVSANMSSLFVALLGVPFPESNSAEARRVLVDALLIENGERIKIAHGECDGAVGVFGCDKRRAYGGVIPGFSSILRKLVEIEPGTAVEIA